MRSDAFLEVAARLAHEVATTAIWCDRRCNWVAAVEGSRASGRAALATLGPDLYGGTSGVALFLAEAGVRLDDERLRATARGAIQLALDQVDRIDTPVQDGLYSGRLGVAYAGVRVAALLGAADVQARAFESIDAWWRDGRRSQSSDLMSGIAGAVVGLVTVGRLQPCMVARAVQLGDELIARAESTAQGWSWTLPGPRSMHNLCGYAHGAAGIGHAFAELFGATGDSRFKNAAMRAFDYERSWLDPEAKTWPDLRAIARRAGRDTPLPTSDSWCNGAPGIALSRLRASELLASPSLGGEADVALAACDRWAAELLAGAPEDYSLCHGAAGAADVLLHAGNGLETQASELGRHGIELYSSAGETRFPCGTPIGQTPGLMLGFSGIGMLYLRLHDRQVESPLLIGLTASALAA